MDGGTVLLCTAFMSSRVFASCWALIGNPPDEALKSSLRKEQEDGNHNMQTSSLQSSI